VRITTLPLERLKVDQRNMRSRLFPSSLQDLAASLKLHGQLYPLLVVPKGEDFAVMDGFRRLEALKIAGIPEAVVGILEDEDADGLQVAYAGNFQREGISYVDEAVWMDAFLANTNLEIAQLAGGICRSEGYVRSRLDVLKWPAVLLDYLETAEVSFSVAREYARLGEGKDLENALLFDRAANPSARAAASYVSGVLMRREASAAVPGVLEGVGEVQERKGVACDGCQKDTDVNQLCRGWFCPACLSGAPDLYLGGP
jgi:ParB family chromosome partitioning protein